MSTISSTNELKAIGISNSPLSQSLTSAFDIDPTAYGLAFDRNGLSLAAAPASEDTIASNESIFSREANPFVAAFSTASTDLPTLDFRRITALDTDELTGLGNHEVSDATSSSQTVYGRLSRYSDELNPTRRRTYKDDYRLETDSTREVTLDLKSSSFDTYLQLVDARTGRVVRYNDDGGSGTDSKVTFTAQANREYLVRATSYYSYKTGGYSLTAHLGDSDSDTPTPPSDRFSSTYGYGLVDAAAAVASARGQSTFSNVRDIGGRLWGNDMVNAPESWARGYTGRGVTVAVIDSGVDVYHDDLRNNIWVNTGEIANNGIDDDGNGFIDDVRGWDFIGDDNTPLDTNGHGTHVAGTIAAANNNIGGTGIAYGARIMPVRVLGTSGRSSGNSVAEGIRYAAANGADVINLSLGRDTPSSALSSAIAYATQRGSFVVMAAGNSSASQPGYPARYATDYGISVGSLDRDGDISDFSNRAGSSRQMHHVMAPGGSIYSTLPNDRYGSISGTSMAAPHVAGVVALMLSANRNLTHAQVRSILTSTATMNRSSSVSSVAETTSMEILANASVTTQVMPAIQTERLSYSSAAFSSMDEITASAAQATAELLESIAGRSLTANYRDDWQYQPASPFVDDLLAPMIA